MKNAAQILREVRAVSGKKDKFAILQANKDNLELKAVLKLAYDSSYNFYIRAIPKGDFQGTGEISLVFALQAMVFDLSTRKVTGSAAKALVEELFQGLSPDNAESLSYVIKRDVKAGISAKTVLSVWPDLFPYFPYMRCSSRGEPSYPAWSDLKSDGIFSRWIVPAEGTSVTAHTRNGTPLINIPRSVNMEFCLAGEGVYEGEMVIYEDGELLPRSKGNGIINKCFLHGQTDLQDNQELHVVLWDILPEVDFWNKVCKMPRDKRLTWLSNNIMSEEFDHLELVPHKIVHNAQEATEHYQAMVALGLEGTVLKEFHAIWKDGTSKEQFKKKVEEIVELRCVGTKPAAEGSKNEGTFGSLLFRSECGKLHVSATGISDEDRKDIHENLEYYMDKVGAVKGNGMTPPSKTNPNWSLFLPNFVEWRISDKDTANTLEEIMEVFKS